MVSKRRSLASHNDTSMGLVRKKSVGFKLGFTVKVFPRCFIGWPAKQLEVNFQSGHPQKYETVRISTLQESSAHPQVSADAKV